MLSLLLISGFGFAVESEFESELESGLGSEVWLVVVNQNSELTALTQKEVMSLFLGRSQFLPTGLRVSTFDFPLDSPIRSTFYLRLTGKNIADIDAYWARLKYSGRASPPMAMDNGEAIVKKVREQQSALAYFPASYAPLLAANGLKTVLTMAGL